jgi:hypothetical protein
MLIEQEMESFWSSLSTCREKGMIPAGPVGVPRISLPLILSPSGERSGGDGPTICTVAAGGGQGMGKEGGDGGGGWACGGDAQPGGTDEDGAVEGLSLLQLAGARVGDGDGDIEVAESGGGSGDLTRGGVEAESGRQVAGECVSVRGGSAGGGEGERVLYPDRSLSRGAGSADSQGRNDYEVTGVGCGLTRVYLAAR